MKHLLEALLISAVAALAPAKATLLTILVLCMSDMVLALRIPGQRRQVLLRSVAKLMIYEFAVFAAFLVQTYLTGQDLPVLSLVGGFVGLTELKSILQRLDTLNGNPLFTTLIERLAHEGKRDGLEPDKEVGRE